MHILELYCGIGGMHYAFKESKVDGSVILSVDINTNANKVYKYNFPETCNISKNIESFTVQDIMKLNIDCILMSPPCQPFTRIGLKKDSTDNRCCSLLHILRLIPDMKNLKYILLENVKGFECSQARNEVISCLKKSDFNYKELILSPCQFGIPNSRHRYYLIAKKKGLNFVFNNSNLTESIPDEIIQILPRKNSMPVSLDQIIFDSKSKSKCFKLKYILEEHVDQKYFIHKDILIKRGHVLDIRTPESNGSCCFTKAYTHYSEGTGSVLSSNSDDNIKVKFCCLNNENGTDIFSNLNIRYFTPKEISRLMSFPEDFKFPNDMTDKQKYRLLGNSINVHVVSQLIYLLNLNVHHENIH